MIDGLRRRVEAWRSRRSGAFDDPERPDYQFRAQREGHPVQRFWHARKWPTVREHAALGATERVLDLGVGSSEIPLRARETGARVCAVDVSTAPLHFLRERSALEGSGAIDFVGGDARALPFREASFSRVVALEVIEHLPPESVAATIAEWRRMLAPGGRLFLTTPNYRSTWRLLEFLIDHLGGAARMGGVQHLTRFHGASLRRVLEEGGFRVRRLGSVYHLSPFVAPLAPRLADRLFAWELRRGGRLGPILFAVAEPV